MLKLKTTSRFERDYRKALKSGKDMAKLKAIMVRLARQEKLARRREPRKLVRSPG